MNIPIAETKSANIEASFNVSKQQLSILLTDQKELKVTLNIPKEKTTKSCTLKKGISLLIDVKEGKQYQILFPEYTRTNIIHDDDSKENDPLKFRSVILFKYWGEE
jgi:hypothetical protein